MERLEAVLAGERWGPDGVRVEVRWVVEPILLWTFLAALSATVVMGWSIPFLSIVGLGGWAMIPAIGMMLSGVVGVGALVSIVLVAVTGAGFGPRFVEVGPKGVTVGRHFLAAERISEVWLAGQFLVFELHDGTEWRSPPMTTEDPVRLVQLIDRVILSDGDREALEAEVRDARRSLAELGRSLP